MIEIWVNPGYENICSVLMSDIVMLQILFLKFGTKLIRQTCIKIINPCFSNLHNYFNIHVFLSLRHLSTASSCPTSNFYYVQSSRSPVRPLLSEAKPSYVYSILKPHGQSSKRQVWLLLSEAKPSCVYSILKPHGQSFRRPVRPLLSEAKPSYVYSILKPPGHSSRSRSDRCWARRSRATYTQF